ncbi:targeting protein for Xklp2-A-like isoform X1 [Acipenser ruthenus]|uniref:targeting protein for Xklp2-A-like isoform X1 n=1 Tax=Acipenser ruthenus TaxID=7906 RepID=UPI00145A9E47|nr:targeting protein for Xklp2-A-like isoform X1 [Acipenser ruthenus]XP_058859926.1 targeting protein for Xklp2-A-like isoform X1 [Acipenser ruthenus]
MADSRQNASGTNYEFDAPSVVINFTSMEHDDHDADNWFDTVADEQLVTPIKAFGASPRSDLPKAVVAPMAKAEIQEEGTKNEGIEDNMCPVSSAASSNLVTSWGSRKPGANQPAKIKAPGANPRRVSKRLSGQQKLDHQRKQMAKIREERRSAATAAKECIPPVKKQRRATSRGKLNETSTADDTVQSSMLQSPKSKSRITRPSTPNVLKRKNLAPKHKSSEQQELEKMQLLQKEVMEQRKRNSESLKSVIAGTSQPPKKVIPGTVPIDFHFRTDDRIKPHGEHHSETSYKEVDFTAGLRKHPPSPMRLKGSTIPKPFNLSCGNKRKFEESSTTEYVSMAQQIESFQKRTPARYHLRSRQREEQGPSPVKNIKLKITDPKTPLLLARGRHRAVTCKSTAEIEAEEMEKMKKFKFKALELNRKVLEGGLLPKKPPVKESTQPIGFDLEIEKRLREREATKIPEEEDYTFHSRPLPVKILEEIVGVPEKKQLPPTVPQSPAFALKNRIRVEHKVEEEKIAPVIKANPMPHFGIPFKPKPQENKHVEACPFSFELRDKEKQTLKERKIEELRKGEVTKFKALPLPDFEHIQLPEKKVKESTNPEPFKLLIDERGAAKSERWEQMMKEELKQQAEASNFKARPNTVIHQEPFVPKKENRSILETISNSVVAEHFELSTERRARERMEFEKVNSEREALRAKREEQERQELEQREKEEIIKLRQDQVHKAQPIRRFKKMEVKHSDQILTVPQSPNFSDRFRL